MTISDAVEADAAELASIHQAVAGALTARYGSGHWSQPPRERGVLSSMRGSRTLIARKSGRIVGTLRLTAKKPWAIDVSYFTPAEKPIYLVAMAVLPERQGGGIGRRLLAAADEAARDWPADVIRLDAYDADAGAGGFYAKCGYREVGRKVYRNDPLVYFERLL
jgi:GNAT superfamily N-acetyltransferase